MGHLLCLQPTFGCGWARVNGIIEGYVFRGVYLNISVWILRGDETYSALAFVLHLVLMFPGNSNFGKKISPRLMRQQPKD